MVDPIRFYFDFSSPYGYLMSEKIDALASQYGREVHWQPILLGVLFQTTGSAPLVHQAPPKAAYYKLDFARSARFLGVPYQMPSRFPLPTQYAARGFYWLRDQDTVAAKAFARAVFRALYVEDRDVSAPQVVLDIAGCQGIDRNSLGTALGDPGLKDRLRAEISEAMAMGVFGSPTVVVDGEPFFGVDRLPQIERWLAEGGF